MLSRFQENVMRNFAKKTYIPSQSASPHVIPTNTDPVTHLFLRHAHQNKISPSKYYVAIRNIIEPYVKQKEYILTCTCSKGYPTLA